jgi:hypothetical protein
MAVASEQAGLSVASSSGKPTAALPFSEQPRQGEQPGQSRLAKVVSGSLAGVVVSVALQVSPTDKTATQSKLPMCSVRRAVLPRFHGRQETRAVFPYATTHERLRWPIQ